MRGFRYAARQRRQRAGFRDILQTQPRSAQPRRLPVLDRSSRRVALSQKPDSPRERCSWRADFRLSARGGDQRWRVLVRAGAQIAEREGFCSDRQIGVAFSRSQSLALPADHLLLTFVLISVLFFALSSPTRLV